MNTLREAAQQALEALELGYDSAKAEADQYHAAMAGYRPQHHAAMDADVQKIAAAITALRAALAEPVKAEMTRDDIIRMARESGIGDTGVRWDFIFFQPGTNGLERFAALVAAAAIRARGE